MSDPTSPASNAPAAGWYDDGTGTIRYWDGATWTEHVAPAPAVAEPAPAPIPVSEAAPAPAAEAAPAFTAPAASAPVAPAPSEAGQGASYGPAYGEAPAAPTPAVPSYPAPQPSPEPQAFAAAGYPEPQYAAPAYPAPQPYGATPYGASQYGAAPTGDSKLLGILALVAAGVGALVAWVPYVGFLGYLLLLTGIVLGIISLVKRQPKWMGITAIAVSVGATIISVIVSIILAVALIGGAVESSDSFVDQLDELEQSLEDGGSGTGGDSLGSQMQSAEFGETLVGAEYEIVVNSIELGATEAVLAADEYNDAPEPGTSYAIVNATYTYTGAGVGDVYSAPITVVDEEGWPVSYAFLTAPEPALDFVELTPGVPVTGNLVVVLADDAVNSLEILPDDFDGDGYLIALD
ncbi:DUF2510 domain-containing protein [Agromyces seonyuensis]|uniref:DUF2510 domain-containing protein n=1 Tax=Agromyces seonyuensis TaxID=2662446 RepID=A0A6I4NUU0_9MICO|nr:DUF2510 domain-containing protein [Agromyces seonyuensis]MWB97851.1 DUF2510 domain-containing protein [Agromyces seonyuensis]